MREVNLRTKGEATPEVETVGDSELNSELELSEERQPSLRGRGMVDHEFDEHDEHDAHVEHDDHDEHDHYHEGSVDEESRQIPHHLKGDGDDDDVAAYHAEA